MPTQLPNPSGSRQACRRVFGALLLLGCALVPVLVTAARISPALIATPAIVSFDESELQLQITSIDTRWALALRTKRLLGAAATLQDSLSDLPRFYDGVVLGDPDSWARINHDTARALFTGHVFTRGALYELEYLEVMGGHTLTRLADTSSAADLAPAGESQANELPDDGSLSAKSAIASAGRRAPRAMKIGIVVDSLYNEHHNGRGLSHALGVINGVDGLYQAQLDLAVVVDGIRVYDEAAGDPLRLFEGTVEQTLERYRDLRLEDDTLPAELALVHLFSGHRDLQKVIGLGWISTVCRLDGYDMSMSTPFPYDMLLSAHEIAHNLGAVHDDDAECMDDSTVTETEIMWSELSRTTRPVFSACSLEKMRTVLMADCIADNIDVGVELNARSTGSPERHSITVTVHNHDADRAALKVTSTTRFPVGTSLTEPSAGCVVDSLDLICHHAIVPSADRDDKSVMATFAGGSQPTLVTRLEHNAFTDTEERDNRASLQLDLETLHPEGTTVSAAPLSDTNPTSSAASSRPLPDNSGPDSVSQSGASSGIGSTGPGVLAIAGLFAVLSAPVRRRRPTGSASLQPQ